MLDAGSGCARRVHIRTLVAPTPPHTTHHHHHTPTHQHTNTPTHQHTNTPTHHHTTHPSPIPLPPHTTNILTVRERGLLLADRDRLERVLKVVRKAGVAPEKGHDGQKHVANRGLVRPLRTPVLELLEQKLRAGNRRPETGNRIQESGNRRPVAAPRVRGHTAILSAYGHGTSQGIWCHGHPPGKRKANEEVMVPHAAAMHAPPCIPPAPLIGFLFGLLFGLLFAPFRSSGSFSGSFGLLFAAPLDRTFYLPQGWEVRRVVGVTAG